MLAQDDASPGDADGDGRLTAFDLDAILGHILGEGGDGNADANGDGKIDIADWVRLNQVLFPADPTTLLPQVSVELSETRTLPAASLTAAFEISGVGPDDDLQTLVRAQAPGTAITTGDERTYFSGVVPANGKLFYLDPHGQWLGFRVPYSDEVLTDDNLQLTLPSDAVGEWAIEVLVQSSDSDVPLTLGRRTLIASSDPTIRLRLNRPIANSTDLVRLNLDTTAGGSDDPVTITALMKLPDGSFVSLPDQTVRVRPVHSGPPTDQSYQLLNRYLTAAGTGMYRVEVKMFAQEGGLLGMANAGFEVCDTPTQVNGTVRASDGSPLAGNEVSLAVVSALDVDERSVRGRTAISADGGYSLELVPGRYLLTSTVHGAGQIHRALSDLVVVGCDGVEQTVDLDSSYPASIPQGFGSSLGGAALEPVGRS